MSGLLRRVLVAASGLASIGCGPKHRLAEYDFRVGTLEVVADVPAYPEVLTGDLFVGASDNPVETVLRMGARAAREVSVRGARERLDSASARLDLAAILEEQAARRASRILGAPEAEGGVEPDFRLELFVSEYGIRATDWDATAYFYLDAVGTLSDARDGSEIWRASISADDPVGTEVFGPGAVRDVVTATSIADLSVQEAVRALEGLADFAADAITERLRHDLAETRRRR